MAPLNLSLRAVRMQKARDPWCRRHAALWIGAVMTTALVWCNGAVAAEPRVLLLRGWLAVFSGGLDHLADELRARGIDAEVRRHLYWTSAVSEILRDRAKIGPLILVGHSQGGNDAIEIARALQTSHVPVDLVVTLAPYMPKPVPANVGRAINYYQGGGWGSPLVPEAGFRGKLANYDLSGDRTIFHFNIDKSDWIQAEILREIQTFQHLEARRAR
jgi:hypothetical protein